MAVAKERVVHSSGSIVVRFPDMDKLLNPRLFLKAAPSVGE